MTKVFIEKYIKPSTENSSAKIYVWLNGYGEYHRYNDEPAIDTPNTKMWSINGKRHRKDDRPALIKIFEGDTEEQYWKNEKLHRERDKPAIISSKFTAWAFNGKFHREGDKPTIIDNRAGKEIIMYIKNDLLHRTCGPAKIIKKYNYYYYENGKLIKSELFFGNKFFNYICKNVVETSVITITIFTCITLFIHYLLSL